MKLVEILARELEKWPEGVSHLVCSAKKELFGTRGGAPGFDERDKVLTWTILSGCGQSVGWQLHGGIFISQKPSDYATAIVTRADWEAERAKLKAHKANGDGWVRHRGGKCPVEAGQPVSVRHRDGRVYDFYRAANVIWLHTGSVNDVMAWKVFKPSEQLDPAAHKHQQPAEQQSTGQDLHGMLRKMDGPDVIKWRDRIRELGTQRAEVESTYQRQISEITQERESLVQKLAGEGLALVEVVVQPVDDMSDWRNWREGDVVECVKIPETCANIIAGRSYILKHDFGGMGVIDGDGDVMNYPVQCGDYLRWKSRPAS